MSGSVSPICMRIKTQIPFTMSRITNENAFPSSGFKFMGSVRSKVKVIGTTKNFEIS